MGIDCSGFTQIVYKINGIKLYRDSYQQANQGQTLSFIEESEAGDLAFFDDSEGNITHVGILLENHYIIHAHGTVRIDRIDQSGIYNGETHTHKLRMIKKIIWFFYWVYDFLSQQNYSDNNAFISLKPLLSPRVP